MRKTVTLRKPKSPEESLIMETVWAYIQTKMEIETLEADLELLKESLLDFSKESGEARIIGLNESEIQVQEVAQTVYDPTSTQNVLKELGLGKNFMELVSVKGGELVKLIGKSFAKTIKATTKTYSKILIKNRGEK
jgi:hypothetical protein